MTRSDWILLAINASPKRTLSPVQLQKALFLFSMNLSDSQRKTEQFYNFEPYDYGPFDRSIYDDADRLVSAGEVSISESTSRYRTYSATPAGASRAEELCRVLHADVLDYVRRVVTWVCSLSFNGLVKAIYREYPAMRANSVFQD